MSINEATLSATQGQEAEQITFPVVTPRQLAWQDVKNGLQQWRIWLLLAWQDIQLRYRRSVLGPFWITISMAITVYSMGYLYSHLFHMNMGEYYPYLVTGMLGWSLIAANITDMVDTLTGCEALAKQIKLPYTLYIHRVACRNVIIFMHNLLVYVPIMIIFHNYVKIGWNLLGLIPGLIILYFNTICYGLIFAMLGARYRDISQLIKSLVQVVFFLTPIMWKPEILPPTKQFIATLNPAYCLLELIRAPLVGYGFAPTTLVMIMLTSLVGFVLAYSLFVPRRARIIYWI